MTTTRPFLLRAAAAAVAFLAFGLTVDPASATTPPTQPPQGADTATPPADQPVEFVQSWTITPGGSENGDEPGTRPNLSYQVAPGTVIDDTVVVFNLGNLPLDFHVYPTDAFNNDEGDFDLLAGDQVPPDVGSWVTMGQEDIVLDPGKQATIPIKITVPVDATPGDHVGGIVASNIAVSDNGDGKIVNVDRRTATRMYIQVNGALIRELAVTNLSTKYQQAVSPLGGTADVTFRVENRGNVRLGGTPHVSVSGPLGLGKTTLTMDPLTELLPGEDVTLTAHIAAAPALFLDSTEVRIDPVQPPEIGGVKSAVGRDRSFAPPLATMVLVVIVLVVILLVRRRRRRDADLGTMDDSVVDTAAHRPARVP